LLRSSQAQLLKRHVKELTDTIDELRFENERFNKNTTSLRSQVVELERQLSIVDTATSRGAMPSQATVEAESKVRELEERLGETNQELKSIVGDRDRLLDLSNKLRVDMMRASPKKDPVGMYGVGGEDSNDPASRQMAEVIRQSEKKVAEKYETKIKDIESSLRSLSEHNRMVRTEVDKWGGPSVQGMHIPGIGIGMGVGEERNESLMDARRALLKAKEDLAGICGEEGPGVWGEYGTGELRARSRSGEKNTCARASTTRRICPLLNQPRKFSLVAGIPLDPGVGGGEVNAVVGYNRPAMLRSRSGYSSSVMTDSQREAKERLARSQRRR